MEDGGASARRRLLLLSSFVVRVEVWASCASVSVSVWTGTVAESAPGQVDEDDEKEEGEDDNDDDDDDGRGGTAAAGVAREIIYFWIANNP